MSAASRTIRLQPGGGKPVAPSAIRAKGKTFVNGIFTDISEPRALELSEIPGIIEDFKRGTENALAAGFDGVEIHGANGYLLDQFAKDGTNKRSDAYGGSIENRAKLMLEVSKVVAAVAGPERTGIRISPVTPANDVSDSNPQPLFDYIVDQLNALKLTYIHVIEGATGGPRDIAPFDYGSLRKRFKQAYVANNGYDFELATKVLAANAADLIAFGKPFISNPDLVERLKQGAPLNPSDKATFYGGGAKGYTDYPTLESRSRRRSRRSPLRRHCGAKREAIHHRTAPSIAAVECHGDDWIVHLRRFACPAKVTEKEKGRDRSRPFVLCITRDDDDVAYFASARFGGVAGHDLTSVS